MKNERKLHWRQLSCLNPAEHRHDGGNLSRLKNVDSFAPQGIEANRIFGQPDEATEANRSKFKELIAVALALTTQCPQCIDFHSSNARNAGVTDAEMFEVAMAVAALQAGARATHATHAVPIKLAVLNRHDHAR